MSVRYVIEEEISRLMIGRTSSVRPAGDEDLETHEDENHPSEEAEIASRGMCTEHATGSLIPQINVENRKSWHGGLACGEPLGDQPFLRGKPRFLSCSVTGFFFGGHRSRSAGRITAFSLDSDYFIQRGIHTFQRQRSRIL